MKNHLLNFRDWTEDECAGLLTLAQEIKSQPDKYHQVLKGKSVIGLFEKASLRTRVSFDVGVNKLGGHFVYVDTQGKPMATREDPKDVGANLSQWADAIVARVFSHDTLLALQSGSSVPVVNALCDLYHPCQALADYLTLSEIDTQGTQHLCYVGDGNNVAHSLAILGLKLGYHISIVCPPGRGIDQNMLANISELAGQCGRQFTQQHDFNQIDAVTAIYTDTWISMGDNTKLEDISEQFMPYQVNEALMSKLNAQFVMHCQPAHRDLEITGSLMDSPHSLLMQQAENRMHAQNAVLAHLLGNQPITL